jgi:hypothetical protein
MSTLHRKIKSYGIIQKRYLAAGYHPEVAYIEGVIKKLSSSPRAEQGRRLIRKRREWDLNP